MKIENFRCNNCDSSIRTYSMKSYNCPFCGSLLIPENNELQERLEKDIAKVNDKKIEKAINNIDKINKLIKNPQLESATDIVKKMIEILLDKDAQFKSKAIITAALLYLVSPVDLIPDAIPLVGYLDDLGILMLAASMIFTQADESVQKYNLDVKHRYQVGPIIYSVVNNHINSDYNYLEEKGRRIVLLSVDDVKRHNFKVVNDTLIKAPEQYIIHPYLSNTLVPLNRYDNILSDHLIREQANIAKMLGAKRIEFVVIDKWNRKSGGNVNLTPSKITKMSNGFDFSDSEEEQFTQYDELGEFNDIAFEYIDNFVWYYTYDSIFNDLIKERLLNNSKSKRVKTQLITATHLDLCSRVNIAKKNRFDINFNFSNIVKRDVEMKIEFFDLPESIKSKNREYYEKMSERLNLRRKEIELSQKRYF